MRRRPPAWLPATAWTVVVLQIVLALAPGIGPAIAFAQEGSPPSSVDRGREYYEQSRFDEAIALLQDLVDRGALDGTDLQKARELLARSLVKKGYPVRARGLFKDILREDPAWRPDPIRVPPDEAAVFEEALREFQAEQGGTEETPAPPAPIPADEPETPPVTPPAPTPEPARPVPASTIVPKKKSNKTWMWIAGGVAVAAVIGVAAAGGGGGGNGGGGGGGGTPLPDFPAPPAP